MFATSKLVVRALGENAAPPDTSRQENAWREYVARSPRSSIYHSLQWRDIISHSFGHTPRYLMADDAGVVSGVLPLFEMRSLLFGHFLVSLPFVNYGGILADSSEVEQDLAQAAS